MRHQINSIFFIILILGLLGAPFQNAFAFYFLDHPININKNISYDVSKERTSDLYFKEFLSVQYQDFIFQSDNPVPYLQNKTGLVFDTYFAKTNTFDFTSYYQGLDLGIEFQTTDLFLFKSKIGFLSKKPDTSNQNYNPVETTNYAPIFFSFAKWWTDKYFEFSYTDNLWITDQLTAFANKESTKFKKFKINTSGPVFENLLMRNMITHNFISDDNQKTDFDMALYWKYQTFPNWILLGVGYNWYSYKNQTLNYSSPLVNKSFGLRSEWSLPINGKQKSIWHYIGSAELFNNQEDHSESQTGHNLNLGLAFFANSQNQINFNYSKSGYDHHYSWYQEKYLFQWLSSF